MNDQKNTEEEISNTTEENSKTLHMTEASFTFFENINKLYIEYENQKSENESFSY